MQKDYFSKTPKNTDNSKKWYYPKYNKKNEETQKFKYTDYLQEEINYQKTSKYDPKKYLQQKQQKKINKKVIYHQVGEKEQREDKKNQGQKQKPKWVQKKPKYNQDQKINETIKKEKIQQIPYKDNFLKNGYKNKQYKGQEKIKQNNFNKLQYPQTKQQKHLKKQYKPLLNSQKNNKNFIFLTKRSQNLPLKVLQQQIRKLKKLFYQLPGNVQNVTTKYSTTHPSIFFEYVKQNNIQYMILRQLIRYNKNSINYKDVISRCYNYLYNSVDPKFISLNTFALLKADQIKVRMTKRSLDYGKDIDQYMFYYTKYQNNQKLQLNFVIFDRYLNSVDFNSKFIQQKRQQYQPQYRLYLQLIKQIQKPIIDGTVQDRDVFGIQQVQSDQQDYRNHQKNQLKQNQKRLNYLLNRDLTQLRQKIQQKEDNLFMLSQNNGNTSILQRLGDQVQQLQITLQNFEKSKQSVQKNLKNVNKNSPQYQHLISMSLKKMIISQKQLQSRLPILIKKTQILQLLKKNNLIILQGQTGSGKSTQLPQILCDFYNIFDNPNAKPVLITQPRKLATRSLAERVAFQMEQKVRGFVDYVASAQKDINPNAKIIFKLDRLVLDQLTIDPILSKYSCLVIDQAHQRTISIDVILGLVKKLLTLRKDFKIIVTSASMNTQLFQNYFHTKTLKVSGRLFPVQIIYKPLKDYNSIYQKIYRVITQQILNQNYTIKNTYRGHILVFCSNVDQINQLCKTFQRILDKKSFKVLPLHGKLTPQQQKQVFIKCKQYKIIFGTRIAQTAITIDGVSVVIDPGKDNQLIYDQKNKISTFKMKDISQSSAKQRAGRAGRTKNGYCFRLYSQQYFRSEFSFSKTPQIQNMALDTLVLRLKSLQIQDIIKFPYLTIPDHQGLKTSIQTMKMIGCLDQNQKITLIGKLLIKLPIQPFLSRSIAQGLIYQQIFKDNKFMQTLSNKQKLKSVNISKSIIQILSMVINSANLFYVSVQNRQLCQKIKFTQFSDQDGDFFFFRNIYQKFYNLYSQRKQNDLKTWSRAHFLNLKALHQARQLCAQITSVLQKFKLNFNQLDLQIKTSKAKIKNCKDQNTLILSCLITSFCTNLCLYSTNPQLGYTIVAQQKPLQIYGTSNLSLQGITPKWIVCYDLIMNQKGRQYCKVAHAITFELLRNSVNQYVFRKFKLGEIQDMNPFYIKKQYTISTLIFKQIEQDYYHRQNNDSYPFLKHIQCFNHADLNKIQFFIPINKIKSHIYHSQSIKKLRYKLQNRNTHLQGIEQQLYYYIQHKKKKYNKPYSHNFIGNIYVSLQDGCQVTDIQLINTQNQYALNLPDQFFPIIDYYCNSYVRIQYFKQNSQKYKMKVYTNKQNAKYFQSFIQTLKLYYPNHIQLKKDIVDRRKKIPQAKIFLHFFAGKSDSPNLYIHYGKNQQHTIDMLQFIKKGLINSNNKIGKILNQHYIFTLCKNSLGINCYKNRQAQQPHRIKRGRGGFILRNNPSTVKFEVLDQYQVQEEFYSIKKDNENLYGFQLPQFIKKFRQFDVTQSRRSDQYWIEEIKQLMKKVGIDDNSNTSLRVWGHYKPKRDKNKTEQQKKFEQEALRNIRVDMHAEIKTLNLNHLQKMKIKYDGLNNILGLQKTHLRFQFQQIIAVPAQKVFNALYQQYQQLKRRFQTIYPLLNFQQPQCVSTRRGRKYFLRARSPNRQDILQPARVISNLYTPKLLKLSQAQFKFLDRSGEAILTDLQDQYKQKIYFGFQKSSLVVKLYCQDSLTIEISQKLKKQISKYPYFRGQISYKGRNLNQVKKILQNKIDQIKQLKKKYPKKIIFLNYQIMFQYRKIDITGDLQNFQNVKNQILKLNSMGRGQCDICCGLMQKPFKFVKCQHSFCWLCLSSYIRQSKNTIGKDKICCPNEDCKKDISIYDIKAVLSFQQFNKICDLKTNKHVETHPDFHQCLSPNCQQVFQKKKSIEDKAFECQLCGKWYCYICKQSHRNYNCQQWKNMKNSPSDDILKKLGIKKCPNCKTGIQKSQGCQHMTCTNCKKHICWNCLKYYQTSKQCYDHLAKQCGGIFIPQGV